MPERETVMLRGGRTLGSHEYGDPGGTPVISCHGGMLCGLDVAPWSEDAREVGIRLVSPDRPGLGDDATFLELNEMDKRFTRLSLAKPRSARYTFVAFGPLARTPRTRGASRSGR